MLLAELRDVVEVDLETVTRADLRARLLKSLSELFEAAGYVDVVGKPSGEMCRLTDEGRKVAQISLS